MSTTWSVLLLGGCLVLAVFQAKARPDPAETQANRAAADELFTNYPVLHLRLEVSEASLESLRKDPRKWVSAILHEEDRVYTNLTLHLKGSRGSFRPVDEKPAITIKAEAAGPSETFHGLKKFHLNNSVQDPSYLSDWLCSPLFRAAEVPTPRSTHALVDLNGRKLGLYVLLESADKEFLARYFTNTQGNLYGQSLNADVTEPLERMSGKGDNTRADLKALAAVVKETNRAKLWEQLPQVLDVDRYLSFMAMEVMLCHWDGYTFATHNFRVYQDLSIGKMVFLPHDFDFMLEDANVPVMPGANGLVSASILKVPPARKLYQERFGTLFTNLFVPATLMERIDRRLGQLLPAVKAYDPQLARTMESHAETLKNRVENRALALAHQLSGPLPFNQFLHGLVLDSETQKPVSQCIITPGFGEDETSIRWERSRVYIARRGIFDMDLAAAKLAVHPNYLRFETPGYLPYVLRITTTSEDEDPAYRIVLKKGLKIAGEVRLPEGNRASGGQIALLTECSIPVLGQGRFISQPGQQIISLRELAKFSFSPDPEARAVVVVHPKGFAEATVEDLAIKPQLTLQPWGSLAGHVSGGVDSVAMVTAELLIPRLFKGFAACALELDTTRFTVEIPAEGPFNWPQVPPGERYLWRSVPIDKPTDVRPSNLAFVGQRLTVLPGRTNPLTWGENERSIKGRLVIDSANAPAADPNVIAINETPFKLGCLKLANVPDGEPSEYFFTFNESDAFRIVGTLPVSTPAEFRVFTPPILLGIARRNIAFANGKNALDLGGLKIERIPAAKIGDPAPDFSLTGLDGTPLKLTDLRGNVVLLSFSLSGSDTQLYRGLKTAWDKFHDHPHFTIVSLSLDRSLAAAQRGATRNDIKWRQAWLGEWFQTELPARYGVASLPAAVLIGTTGQLLAINLPPPNLEAEIQTVLEALTAKADAH
jgi:spore coat protein H